MKHAEVRRCLLVLAVAALAACSPPETAQQSAAPAAEAVAAQPAPPPTPSRPAWADPVPGEWRHHGGDLASSKYTSLDQITPANISTLEVAWRWESADKRLGDVYDTGIYVATPLMAGGKVYAVTSHGQVAALDPATGKQLWVYDPRSWAEELPTQLPRHTRGIEYWTDGTAERVIVATMGKQLVSIDVATGKPDPAFGNNGVVDLKGDLDAADRPLANISHGAPPIVVRDTIVVGSKIHDFVSKLNNPPGHIRAYDVRTGKLKWRFNTIPQAGEPFVETWENDAWKTQGNTNAWTFLAADPELGHVYVPLSTPTNDYYGGERLGDNVYAESLVAIDVETGKRVWHFQTVHHGIWDYDIASAPNLLDVVVNGKPVKAVAQASKTAFLYVFDRVTGEPLWPIEERPVEASTVPGERLAPTQPHPTRPAPFDRQGATVDDVIDFTPELKAEALKIFETFKSGPIFTPLIVEGEGGKVGTLFVPGAGGGASFPGASVDPATGVLFVESVTRPSGMALVSTADNATATQPEPGTSAFRYEHKSASAAGPQKLPLLKPPYRRVTAIDLNTGDHVWQVPVGPGPTNHPAIKHLNLGPMGSVYPAGAVAEGGILVTPSMLVNYLANVDEQGDQFDRTASSAPARWPKGGNLLAMDKKTGAVLAQLPVEHNLRGSPMTYEYQGRQYIVIAGGGSREPAELFAFALPQAAAAAALAAAP